MSERVSYWRPARKDRSTRQGCTCPKLLSYTTRDAARSYLREVVLSDLPGCSHRRQQRDISEQRGRARVNTSLSAGMHTAQKRSSDAWRPYLGSSDTGAR